MPDTITEKHEKSYAAEGGMYRFVCTCGYRDFLPSDKRNDARLGRPCPQDKTVVALVTLQMSWGGLFDGRPADGYAVHLVRCSAGGGTPGPALCGIDRFAPDAPGWSVGGGIGGPSVTHKPCPGCADAAREQFPGLPVTGSVGGKEMAEFLGVEHGRR